MTGVLDRIWTFEAQGADLSTDGLLLVAFAGCSLDESPKSNWVQDVGGLPDYICQVARAIKRSGHTTSEAIQLAVGTVKNWASGQKHVNDATRAKAAAAVTEWEAKKAASHAKSSVKTTAQGESLISLCADTFNVDAVSQAFRSQMADKMYPGYNKNSPNSDYIDHYSYVSQIWSNFLIVTGDLDNDNDTDYYKVPYSVDPDTEDVTFGKPLEVKQEWVTSEGTKIDGSDDIDANDLNDDDFKALMKLARAQTSTGSLNKFVAFAAEKRGDNPTGAKTDGPYADPKNKKYPIDTAARVRSALSYISNSKNASVYPLNGVTLASVKAKIMAAAKKFGIETSADDS